MVATKKGKAAKPVKVKVIEQGPHKLRKIVNIGCKQGLSDIAKIVEIFNNTDQHIARGTKILWETSEGDRGITTLQSSLAPGKSIKIIPSGLVASFSCTAWYFEPPPKRAVRGSSKTKE